MTIEKKPRLSKSKVILGLQCEKALYLSIHQPDMVDEVSNSQQLIFDQGHTVGILAQKLFPDGVLIDAPYTDSALALKQTQDAIVNGALNIYEATFQHNDVLVKVDILARKSVKHVWEIVEVKSSTQVKEVHIPDAAVQLWVCRESGHKVKSVSIMYINNQCEFPDLSNLFSKTDVTTEAEALLPKLPSIIDSYKEMLAAQSHPKKDIGPHCDDPYGCTFKTHCWSLCKIPAISVFDIPRLSGVKKWELYYNGSADLTRLDVDGYNATQKRMIECTVAARRFIDAKAISKALSGWTYPLSFLDFETIGYAIPKYKGQRPYQQLPFQFSCHIRQKPGLEHREYLHTSDTDPRESVCRALVEMVPKSGSVVAYNMGFEKGVLQSLSDLYPKYKKDINSIADRLVDPLPIIRANVYDPAFGGSFSIKSVAPALLGQTASYDEMAVGDGTEAQTAYLEMINPETTTSKKEKLRRDLIEYCTKDTMGMVQIVDWLYEQTNAPAKKRSK